MQNKEGYASYLICDHETQIDFYESGTRVATYYKETKTMCWEKGKDFSTYVDAIIVVLKTCQQMEKTTI